jgi:hypothetical protein
MGETSIPWSTVTKTWGALIIVLSISGSAFAQGNSAPILGGTGGLNLPKPLPLLNGNQSLGSNVHRGPNGKPCLTMVGNAVPQVVKSNIYDHTVVANNDCSIPIRVQVCYYRSQECSPLTIPPYGRKELVLGIMPAMSQFRFEYREQFDGGMAPLGFGLR